MRHPPPSGARRRIVPARLVHLLLSRRLAIRFAALLSLGIATFVICQAIAYWWLPEGLLSGRSIGALAGGEEAAQSFGVEWAHIVGFNVFAMFVYVAANLIRFSNGVPLGYFAVILMQGYFGATSWRHTRWPRQRHTRSADGKTSGSRARRKQSGFSHPREGGATLR